MAEGAAASSDNKRMAFILATPDTTVIDAPAYHVVLPAEDGEIGVFLGHTRLVTVLNPGLITLLDENEKTEEQMFITGGFADVAPHRCTVMVKSTVQRNALKPEEIAAERQALETKIETAETQSDRLRFTRELEIVVAKAKAVHDWKTAG